MMPFSGALESEHWPGDILAGFFCGVFGLLAGMPTYAWAIGHWTGAIPPSERRGTSVARSLF